MTPKTVLHDTILKPAVQVTLLSLANLGVGFFVQVMLAARFGAGAEMDTFLAASTVPTTLSAILLSTLNVTFIPVFTQCRTTQGTAEAWKLASGFATALVLGLLLLTGAGMMLAPQTIRLTTPGFTPGTEVFVAAVQMSRVIFPTLLFVGISSLFSNIAYAEKVYLLPATAPVLNSLMIILGTWLLAPRLGIHSVAWGTVAGGMAQCLLLLPVAIGPERFRFRLDWHHPGLQKTVRLMLPLLLGGFIFRANTLADRFVASTFAAGSIAQLGYGLKMLNILWAITSSGIVLSIFPYQSEYGNQNKAELGRVTAMGIRLSLIVSLAVGSCFLLLRHQVIQLFFERGAFTAVDTTAVSNIMFCYAAAFFAPAIFGSATYALYALQQTGLTTLIGITGATLNFLLLIPFSAWGVNGVALAYSVATLWNAAWVLWLLTRRFQVPVGWQVGVCFLKTGLAAVVAALLPGFLLQTWSSVVSMSIWWQVMWLLSATLLFGLVYVALLLILQVEEVWQVWAKVRARWQPVLAP